jgi:DNA-directed RNA polymerase sigma subunit (sigma70/sigma32)
MSIDFANDEEVLAHLEAVETVPPLSRADEIQLAQDITLKGKAGEEAAQKLIEANLKVAFDLALEYRGRGLLLMDLIQYANLGLMKAVDRFDYRIHDSFAKCATPLIRQLILVALEKRGLK